MFNLSWAWVWGTAIAGLLCSSLNAATLKEIQKRGTIRIGVKNNLPLLGYTNPEGQLEGFEIELAQKISRTIWGDRIQIEYVPLLNQARLGAVTNGQVDLAIANLHVTETRRRVVFFSQPYLTSTTGFVTQASRNITISSIKTGTIGVLQGSVAIGRLQARFSNTNLIGLNSYAEAQQKLLSGQVDSFAGDMLILRGWQYPVQEGKPGIERSDQDSTAQNLAAFQFSQQGIGLSQIAIAMPKGLQYRNLHDAVDLALDTLESSGELQQMRNKWRLSLDDRTALDRLEQSSGRLGAFPINLDLAPNVY